MNKLITKTIAVLPKNKISIFSKDVFRLIRIWWFGKYKLARAVHKRMIIDFWNTFNKMATDHCKRIIKKYQDFNYDLFLK